jgi:mRNA-degrading endonuclease YafQ of YafQ-DinJ toxin-antitoxin module
MYELVFPDSYKEIEKKFFKKHSNLLSRYEKILWLLKSNPFHPSLRLHKLNPPLEKYHSLTYSPRIN